MFANQTCSTTPIKNPAFLPLIHTCFTCATYISHYSVYLQMTESYSTSHSFIVWTQEANWPYRGQTHKAVLAVGWRGMRKCMCVYVCGGGWRWEALPPILLLLKSSHERPCQELQCGLSRPSQRQSRLHDAASHSHTADLRSYCNCCCSGRRARSWTVCYGIEQMQDEKRAKESQRKEKRKI